MNSKFERRAPDDEDVFLSALAYEAAILDYLAHVCRSFEMHNWRKIDQYYSVQEGYRLLEACVKDEKTFKRCIQAIGIALQVQDYYGYSFTNKLINDPIFDTSYELILPDASLVEEPGIDLCENALYACRLFEKICQGALPEGRFQADLSARFAELGAQSAESAQLSIEQRIRSQFDATRMLPIEKFTAETSRVNYQDSLDGTDKESISTISSLSVSPIQELEQCEPVLMLSNNVDETAEYLAHAYREYEANGKLGKGHGSYLGEQGRLLVEACFKNHEILYHCLQAIEFILQYAELHQYRFDQKYHAGLGYMYTLPDAPYQSFSEVENALYARDLFQQLYEHGYHDESVKKAFELRMQEVLSDPDRAHSLPHICAMFQTADKVADTQLSDLNTNESGTQSMPMQGNIAKIDEHLRENVAGILTQKNMEHFLLLSLSVVLSIVQIVIQTIGQKDSQNVITVNDKPICDDENQGNSSLSNIPHRF